MRWGEILRTVDDSADAPHASESSSELRIDQAAEGHLQHDDRVGLEGVLVGSLDGVELLGVLVVGGGVQVRVVDVVCLASLDDLVHQEAIHEEGAAED